MIFNIDYNNVSKNDLFCIGKKIYSSSTFPVYCCQTFIRDLIRYPSIPEKAKIHLLNGISYALYFGRNGKINKSPKNDVYESIIKMLDNPIFKESRDFINSFLLKIEDRPIYIAGQENDLEILASLKCENDKYYVDSISYKGKQLAFVYDAYENTNCVIFEHFGDIIEKRNLKKEFAKKLFCEPERLKIKIINDEEKIDKIFIPHFYDLIYK